MQDKMKNLTCPECGERYIDEHPSAHKYNEQESRIKRASECRNPDCEKGLLALDEVEEQL